MKPQFVSQFDHWHTDVEAAILTLRCHGHQVTDSYVGTDWKPWHIVDGRAMSDGELIARGKALRRQEDRI
jgi:hypothetical protein